VNPQPLPNEHHTSRYIGPLKIYQSFDGKRRVEGESFLPRADYPPGTGPEEFVSVDWLEHFTGTRRQQLDQVRKAVEDRGRKASRSGGFAVVNVLDIKTAGFNNGRKLLVHTTGELYDPSHSGIYGLTPEDEFIAQEIAFKATIENALD